MHVLHAQRNTKEINAFYYVAFDVVWDDVFWGEYKHTLIDSQSEIPLEYVGCVYV